jgi:hypothetical protein
MSLCSYIFLSTHHKTGIKKTLYNTVFYVDIKKKLHIQHILFTEHGRMSKNDRYFFKMSRIDKINLFILPILLKIQRTKVRGMKKRVNSYFLLYGIVNFYYTTFCPDIQLFVNVSYFCG